MRRLILLRHAKTETDAPSGRDQDRRLDERGRTDAAAVGSWIGLHQPLPGLVLVSPAVRARQTWEIVSDAMQAAVGNSIKKPCTPPSAGVLEELYGADPAQILETVHTASARWGSLMVIGHNPGMHELALALVGSGDAAGQKALADNLPTAGLAIFDFAVDDWADVAFRRGKLVAFVSPRLLRQASTD